ncbi:hypothetical protein MPSEU_000316200 [Mayamaea pseudoterrestris]|nr:hypothetical protein MPSEU_000316200 [Mayamaea pseudoterrestris]
MANTTKILIEKATARVFCQQHGAGGNPVTIFSSATAKHALSSTTQQTLAQTCEWESVMLDRHRQSMNFYMPTGEEVSFCAHAAMGGAGRMMQQIKSAQSGDTTSTATGHRASSLSFSAELQPNQPYKAFLHDHGIVSLDMEVPFIEQKLQHPPQLQRILRDAFHLQAPNLQQLRSIADNFQFPTFVNASVARLKTLVYVNDLDVLHAIKAPPVGDAFRNACDAVESTGLYLYSPLQDNDQDEEGECVFECRQFPRASGYPEDPATGIAAAALAVSLYERGMKRPFYKFHQGTAMSQPSLIMVENISRVEMECGHTNEQTVNANDLDNVVETKFRFRLTGKVEYDSREEIEVVLEE